MDDSIKAILSNREWQTFECKRALIKPAKLLDTACAFANSEGGVIIIGLEDPEKAIAQERIMGIAEGLDNVSDFLKLLSKEFDPPLGAWDKLEIPVKNVAGDEDILQVIRIFKAKDVHSLKNGDTFIRNGRQNTKIGSSEIVRLKYEKGSLSYESETTDVELDDLDGKLLEEFKKSTGSQSDDTWQFLKDNGFAKKVLGKYRLTKAGVLLFGRNPSVSLESKVGVRVSHYHGTEIVYSGEPNFARRPFTFEGPATRIIEKTLDYFRSVAKSAPPRLVGSGFASSFLIPEWAFQEAITNAVVHRNYSIQDDIHIRIFDDRIEIESPGVFPGFVNKWNIRSERFARNPILQRGLSRFEEAPNLDIGEGVDRMYREMYNNNLYEPVYLSSKVRPNSVQLFLFNIQRIEHWDVVRNYLEKNGNITNGQARSITGIYDSVEMSRLLKQWVGKGLLEKSVGPSKKMTSYTLSESDFSGHLFSESEKIDEG